MSVKKPLSRRTFLRGVGGITIGLPFLEAMLPSLAWAAAPVPRLIVLYGGVPTYFQQRDIPLGALGATLPTAVASLAAVRQHVSILTNMRLPVYNAGTTPPAGGCINQQHYTAPAPSLAGVTSMDAKPMMYKAHTVDQVYADAIGAGSKYKSIQACAQAIPYNGSSSNTSSGGQVSSRFENGQTNVQEPEASPLALYNKLFGSGTGSGTTTAPLVAARKSVLDLVLDDANRINSSLSGADKVRLEQHFDEIRNIEKTLASTTTGGTGTCSAPTKPGPDVAPSTRNFGGWAEESMRRDLMADMIALAVACDLTRAVSFQLSYDQCWIGSKNITGVNSDLHQISHDVNNDTTGALRTAMAKHTNWHCEGFARIVAKLASMSEGSGTVLDSTFMGMCFGEGTSAHNRTIMHTFFAGAGGKMKLGQHINGNNEHTARMWVSGLNALGVPATKLGEITGMMTSILK